MIDLTYYKPQKTNKQIIFRCSKIYDFQTNEGFGGIGDRIVGLVSSFILALLLNYEFRIHWKFPIELNKIFNENNNIFWNKKDYDLKNINEIRLMDNDILDNEKQDLLINKIHNLNDSISIVSNKFFVYYLLKNINFKERINLLNINEINIYRDAIHLLFNFNNEIQLKYNKLLYNLCNYFTIGIQIRSFIQEFNIKLSNDDYQEYIDYIDNIINKNKNKKIMLLISSDSIQTTQYFSNKYSNYQQIIISGDIIHLEKSQQHNINLNNNIKLFLEIWALGKCNELIITNSSNFGRCAALRTMKIPYLCYKLVPPNPNKYDSNTFKMPNIDLNKNKPFLWKNILTKDNLYN